jgi:competence ComEA-like helix-hairpin-helix protein
MKMRQVIREYFTFTKNERIGLFILLALILVVLLANKLIFYFETPAKIDSEKFKQLMGEMAIQEKTKEPAQLGRLFHFNPNTIDSIQLDSLKLPVGVKRNLLKYRGKGGYFYGANDFRKIYGMNDSVFDEVKPYIKIGPREKKKKLPEKEQVVFVASADSRESYAPGEKAPESIIEIIEINVASAPDLVKLKGIGQVLSERIVKYRNLLGGFTNLEQLSEVYGLKPETIEIILPYLSLDGSQVDRMNVNFAGAPQLAKHPYITWEIANSIINFRSGNGFIDDIELLKTGNILNESDYQRISPYLKTKE